MTQAPSHAPTPAPASAPTPSTRKAGAAARWCAYGKAVLLGLLAVPAFLPMAAWPSYIPATAALPELLLVSLTWLMFILPLLSLGGLILMWQRAFRARQAAAFGFFYGVGLFGGGIHWIYIAMTTFGGMAIWIALIGMVALIAYMSLFPALAGYAAVRFFTPAARWWAIPALWGLSELLRAYLFTGLPWLSMAYTQALPSPLAGYVPVGGVYLTSVIVVALSACMAYAVAAWRSQRQAVWRGVSLAALLLLVGAGLNRVEWSEPVGAPLPISLVQGNIAQNLKFDPAIRDQTYAHYQQLAEESKGRLVVLPESAFPDFADQVPDEAVVALTQLGLSRRADYLVGMFTRRLNLTGREDYFNSVVNLGMSPLNVYRKRHLVPFGEKIPFEEIIAPLMNALIAIPLAGQSEGGADQPPFKVAGQKVALTICFEDVFGSEQIRSAQQATLLANFTNDAWYGHSMAAWQHHRIASMRALETARPLLRATNTGVTALIDHRGQMVNHLPWFTTGILESEIAGRQGDTPYLRWGDWLGFGIMVVLCCFVSAIARYRE